jgi:hypothetical protein
MNAMEKVAYILGTQIGNGKQEEKSTTNNKIAKAASLLGKIIKNLKNGS